MSCSLRVCVWPARGRRRHASKPLRSVLWVYSPNLVEGKFSEGGLPLYGVLGSSLSSGAARRRLRIRHEAPENSIGDAPLEAPQRLLTGFALCHLLAVLDPAPGVRPGLTGGDHMQGALLSLRLPASESLW